MPKTYTKRYPVGEFGHWLDEKINSLPCPFYIFSDQIGLSPQVIRRHMREVCRPSVRITQIYADYFREDFNRLYEMILRDFSNIDNSEFSMWLWENMRRCGYTISSLAQTMNVSETSIYIHLSARPKCYPSFRMTRKYCDAFGLDDPFTPYDRVMHLRDSHI